MLGSNAADSSRAAASSDPDLEYSVAVVSMLSLCWESLRGRRGLAVWVKVRTGRWDGRVRALRGMVVRRRRRRKGVGDMILVWVWGFLVLYRVCYKRKSINQID